MSTTTLLEAHQRFAAALDELRRNYVAEFDQWLKTAANFGASEKEARERIAAARMQVADEFLDRRAPAIIRSLNRDAEHDILKALRTYNARPQPLPTRRRSSAAGLPWQASLWRTGFAAAFGAVVGVILLALQATGDGPVARDTMVLWLLAAAFVAALGAAVGAFIVACPPASVLLERAGLSGVPLLLARKLGAVFVLLRAGPFIVLAAALLTGFFALIAWLLGGSRPLHVLIGVTALAVILAARWTAPDSRSPDRDAIHRQLLAELDGELISDANVWAALAAALVLRRDDGAARTGADVRAITNIILARRAQHEPPEEILQVIEQHLGLPCGPQAGADQPAVSEFVWKAEHALDYTTFGAVQAGDMVTVSSRPLYIDDGSGAKRVSQKGVVTRKR